VSTVSNIPQCGLLHDSVSGVGPVDTPLTGLRIVEAHGQTLDVQTLVGAFDVHFFDFAATVQDLAAVGGAVEFHPFGRAYQALLQALEMEFSGADGVVEIVLAVARVGDDLLRVDCCVMVAEALDRKKEEADEENGEQGFMRSH
jgi:hypothetical protein